MVNTRGGSASQVAAALLHDTVEDTDLSVHNIRYRFGDEVADIVSSMTKPADISYDEYVGSIEGDAVFVKWCDSRCNYTNLSRAASMSSHRKQMLLDRYRKNLDVLSEKLDPAEYRL